MQSRIPRSRYFQESSYYAQKLFPAWLAADMAYWQSNLNSSSTIWGHQVQNKIFGCGAGASPPHKYGVDRITDAALASATDGVFSAAIMAGFLGAFASKTIGDAMRAFMNSRDGGRYQSCMVSK